MRVGAHYSAPNPKAASDGSSGSSAVIGGAIVLITLAAVAVLFLRPNDVLRGVIDRARDASDQRPPSRRNGKKRVNDGETESMVAASLVDEDDAMESAARDVVPTRAGLDDLEEPSLSSNRVDHGITFDDDDGLQIEESRTGSVILGRPEL